MYQRICEVCGIELPQSMSDERIRFFGHVVAYVCTVCQTDLAHRIDLSPQFRRSIEIDAEKLAMGSANEGIRPEYAADFKRLHLERLDLENDFHDTVRAWIPSVQIRREQREAIPAQKRISHVDS